MLRVESAPSGAPAGVRARPAKVSGWGGGERVTVSVVKPSDLGALAMACDLVRGRGGITRGLGRSYGDAAQLSNGVVVQTTRLRDFQLDARDGIVTAQAGVTIGELLRTLAPAGWMVPVVPGTQYVTVGGAIASDIHGKDHPSSGTFGSHVRALGLLTASGEVLELLPGADDGLFEATLGGMGLTGTVAWAQIKLRPMSGPLLSVDSDRVGSLDEALSALTAPGGRYRAGWLDLLGSHQVRGVVTRAEHSPGSSVSTKPSAATVESRFAVPRGWPGGLLRKTTMRAFNELRYRRSPGRERGRICSFGEHMFPLDALDAWPRLYGRRGLIQYQFVVPPGRERALEQVIDLLHRSAVPCFLAVLKEFGGANAAPLSFPIRGWTLALDLPRGAPELEQSLRRCDTIVAEAGGRVYLTKDARLAPDAVSAMYPQLSQWRAAHDRSDPDRMWRSDLSIRTGLVDGVDP